MLPENKPEDRNDNGRAAAASKEEAHTEVPNAHASGLGAMGRNDEKLPTSATDEADDQPEPAY